jgi:hypothetical protein
MPGITVKNLNELRKRFDLVPQDEKAKSESNPLLDVVQKMLSSVEQQSRVMTASTSLLVNVAESMQKAAVQQPIVQPPMPVRQWNFKMVYDNDGMITDIIATAEEQ